MQRRTLAARCAVALILCALPSIARAEQQLSPVVRIEGLDVFFDTGGRTLRRDAALKVFRTVEALHPQTGQVLRDRFLVGELRVVETGGVLALARPSPELARRLSIGDVVELPPSKEDPPAPTQPVQVIAECPEPPPAPPPPPPDPDDGLLKRAFAEAADLDARDRAALWTQLSGRFRSSTLQSLALRESAFWSERAQKDEKLLGEIDRLRNKNKPPADLVVHVALPEHVAWNAPLEATVVVEQPDRVRGAVLSLRSPSEAAFQTRWMQPVSDGVYRTLVPANELSAGAWSAVVEVQDRQGKLQAVKGEVLSPERVAVDAPPPEKVRFPGRSRISLRSDLVDFNNVGTSLQPDSYYFGEADFLYRIRAFLYSVRVGYGVYAGAGMPLESYDLASAKAQTVGFNYGYAEFEFQLAETFSVMTKPIVGITRKGLAGGFEVKARIGREDGTNLLVGGQTIGDAQNPVGQAANLKLTWNALENVPMAGEVVVTDQPVGDAVGVRLVYEAGFRLTPWCSLTARAGYNIRKVGHSGFGLGAGATFDW